MRMNKATHRRSGARRVLSGTSSTIALAIGAMSVAVGAHAATPDPETPDYGAKVSELVITSPPRAAITVAPVKASLKATEPQSIITRQSIDQFVPETADYTEIVNLAPSMSGTSFNGPGLGEAKSTLRGFKDGEYNITYDGIPWGDANGPTHHSTSFFPSSTVGAVVVERGPGAAGDFGMANFGGSVNLFSPEVSHDFGGSESVTGGSWNTWMSVTKINTGDISQLNGAHILFNFQELTTDGAQTYSQAMASNQMVRAVFPLFGSWNLTAYGDWNFTKVHANDNSGVTLAQVALYGKNYALNNDPASPNYAPYNIVTKNTYFNYLKLNGNITPSLKLENTIYSYYYHNDTESTLDSTLTPAEAAALTVKPVSGGGSVPGLPGYIKLNVYKIYGDMLHMEQALPVGDLKFGVWLERADTGPRARFDYIASANRAPDYRQSALTQPGGFVVPRNEEYLQYSGWKQYQPFVDFVWRATPDLTITPGLKYMHDEISVNATVNQKSRLPFHGEKTFTKTLYFLTANYKVRDDFSVYGQYATGMLVPDISITQFASTPGTQPNLDHIQPQTSTNYQLGGVYHGNRLTIDADVYYIDFHNKLQQIKVGSDVVEFNLGGAVYKGVEGQVSYQFTDQVYGFANGSINSALTKGVNTVLPGPPAVPLVITPNKQIANAPTSTAALGGLYRAGGWSISLVDKYVGKTWASEGQFLPIAAYNSTDLKVVYNFGRYRAEAGVYNLFNSQQVTAISPVNKTDSKTGLQGAIDPHDQYYFQPERNYQISLKANF